MRGQSAIRHDNVHGRQLAAMGGSPSGRVPGRRFSVPSNYETT